MISYPTLVAPEKFEEALNKNYDLYQEKTITHRRFKQSDIIPLIKDLKQHKGFDVAVIGKSVEGREIRMVKIGEGKTKILLWSQMHGDEPTATMAIMDIFNFFKQKDELDSVRNNILQNTTLYFIPMLNPDGAQQYTRRNAQGLDINRDALKLQSPEAVILKKAQNDLKPDFGFNLHDQNIRYSAGNTDRPATISFLAPPYDKSKSVNDVRENAMKMIVHLNDLLQNYIPGQVGKFSDEYEPRAFGDNFQKWGTSTVLIESGGYSNDIEKQYIRKLNFIAILSGLHAIANGTYLNHDISKYYEIPENQLSFYDLLIRNAFLEKDGQIYKTDIGINRYEINVDNNTGFYIESKIEELGDMGVYYGYEELDAEGLLIEQGKTFPQLVNDLDSLKHLDLIKNGYTNVKIAENPKGKKYSDYPLNLVKKSARIPDNRIELDNIPNFVLKKQGEVLYGIINGFVYDVKNEKNGVKNSLVY